MKFDVTVDGLDLTLCIDTESQTITLMQYDQSVILTVDHLEQACQHVFEHMDEDGDLIEIPNEKGEYVH